MPGAAFSDTWYRVAGQRVALQPAVQARAQRYRGQLWFVLEDVYAHRFFRVTPQAYDFARALDTGRTVDEVWREYVRVHGAAAPGQDEVVRLLSQLHVSNMLVTAGSPDSHAIDERSRRQKDRELQGKLLSFLYVRVPVFNPNRLLDRLRPLVMACTGRAAGVVWLLAVLAGVWTAVEHSERLGRHADGVLSLSNLPWLYLGMTLLKVLHETAHAFVVKRYGGQVHTFGVMFLIFTPLPYVDATATWGFGSRWRRAYVGLAGVATELFFAALATLLWAHTAEGPLNGLAFNIMFIGSVSALLFNGNPLLRFDAYYVLTDLVEMPNLYQKGQQQVMAWCDRVLLGNRAAAGPATDATERLWFTTYGWASFAYRLLLSATILLTTLDKWFGVGLALLATTVVTLLVLPGRKFAAYLAGPAVAGRRTRAVGTVAGLVLVAYVLAAWVPLPHAVRVPGVLEAQRRALLFVESPGVLTELRVRHGQSVRRGEVLAELRNPDLDLNIDLAALQLDELRTLQLQSLQRTPADAAPLQVRIDATRQQLDELRALRERLTVRAPQDGEWVAPQLHERRQAWIERGQLLGEVVDAGHYRFSAVLAQGDAADLFGAPPVAGELRLAGQAGQGIAVQRLEVIPYQRERLASPALGLPGGGEVAVRPDDSTGTMAAESFFELRAPLPAGAAATTYAGMSGVLRVALPAQPLWDRFHKGFLQLLQKRYAL
ncbi:biotin/lipoyl-binding protein [Pseudacidovorax intermedius]|uniref:biotin/lipoyl-binding protein n=1 Tax=Pseudacidovorax intermedius TaxID=433924 RepID=UPI0026EE0AD3|nr:biotin/lipoyl-binding protein [Pseudacidovorax intermedius]